MITYITGTWSNTQIANWIIGNGGFSLHYNVLQQYLSSLDIRTLLASYSNLKISITLQYSTSDIVAAMVSYSSAYVWETLYPYLAPGTLFSDVYSHEIANDTYDVLTQYFWSLIATVQTDNYYYSKTDYFDQIKTIYGQYTYDVLVGKFITLSNQFKDVFVLSEWHMYGSSRLGIQKPVSKDSHAELVSASAATGRELVHIEFNGSWSSYEVNYSDTSNTTVTTYQMSYEYYSLTRGEKNYELVNHLGNVLVVISDKKLKVCAGDTVNYYTADVVQANDYYAFHATMSGRTYTADTTSKYRFGASNGQEKDAEIFAGAYSAEYWEYDSRLGRRWNVDPVVKPHESPYATFSDNPIYFTDPNGDNPPEKGFFEKIGNMFNRAGNWLKGNAAKNRVNDYMKTNNIDPKSVNINYGKDGKATITSNKRIESSVGADGTSGYKYNADVVTIYKNGIITKNTAWEQSDVEEAMASNPILAGSLIMKYAINGNTAQGGGGIDWGMVGNGSVTVVGGALSTGFGVAGIASGVGAPAGVAGVVLGVPTIGFGVANIIDGFQGGHRKLPTGPAEATDIGFGGDGTVGQVIDLLSGGLPKNTRDGLLFGYGLYNSNIGQAIFSPRPVLSSTPRSLVMPRDNTNVVMPRFPL